ncbi:hypothetical protein ACFZDK_21995 [Streptomyces sp. NPDC007901]|uniref:hypothetical protein n=1 Tax=Streptomyces sp. NPDC007901 TaxID=3364785 RepID=UPI0036ECF965
MASLLLNRAAQQDRAAAGVTAPAGSAEARMRSLFAPPERRIADRPVARRRSWRT